MKNPRPNVGRIRPAFVEVRFGDPLDGELLGTSKWPYNIRKAADGWYSRAIRIQREGIRPIFRDVLEGRIPSTKTTLIPWSPKWQRHR